MKKFKLFLAITLSIFLITGCSNNKKVKKEETKDPNAPVVNYKTVKDLKFGTASFYISGGKTFVDTSIINETNKDIKVNKFTILFKDSDNNIIKTLDVSLDTVKKKETININEFVDEELFQTAHIDYEIK